MKFGLTRKTLVMVAIIVLGSFTTILNQTFISPALPTIMREFSVDAATVQWLTTGFLLVNAVMIPVTAYIQEKFPTKSIFAFAMFIFALGSAFCGWAPSFELLLCGRLIQAIGAGIMMPMTMSIMLITFPLEHRGTAMGIVGTVFACAPAIGPSLSGFLVAYIGWHIMFWGLGILCVVLGILGIIFIESKKPEGAKEVHLDVLSVVLSTFGLGFLLYGLSIMGSSGITLFEAMLMLAGVILVILFCIRQTKLDHPMLEIRVLKSRNFTIATFIGMVAQAGVTISGILMPIYIQTVLGYDSFVSGLVILPGALLSAAVNVWAGRFYDKHGPRMIILTGIAMFLVANICFGLMPIDGTPWLVAGIFIIRQFGIALHNMTATTWGMATLDDSLAPHATSVQSTLRTVAASLGTAIVISITSIVQNTAGATHTSEEATLLGVNVGYFSLSAAILVIFIVSFIFIKSQKPAQAKEEATIVDELTAAENKAIINKLMKKDVYCLKPTERVEDALSLLVEKGISGAPVADEENRPIGFFSDGDFLKRLATTTSNIDDPLALMCLASIEHTQIDDKLHYLMQLQVKDLCVNNCICASTSSTVGEICRILSNYHLKKIPVCESGKIVGVINRSDITKHSILRYLEGVNK